MYLNYITSGPGFDPWTELFILINNNDNDSNDNNK
jgi:hypothetical protein